MNKNTIEVCFAPALFPYITTKEKALFVVVDILRATTSMSLAFHNGARSIIPVSDVEETRKFKDKGLLIAGERDCRKVEGFDFGNSPFDFVPEKVRGRTIAYSTTNGTQAIELAKNIGSVMIAAFVNFTSSLQWIMKQNKNTVIFCSGWQNTFSLEDAVFAGALIDRMMNEGNYEMTGDSSIVSLELWKAAQPDYTGFLRQGTHRNRLLQYYSEKEIDFCFSEDITRNIILLKNGELFDVA